MTSQVMSAVCIVPSDKYDVNLRSLSNVVT